MRCRANSKFRPRGTLSHGCTKGNLVSVVVLVVAIVIIGVVIVVIIVAMIDSLSNWDHTLLLRALVYVQANNIRNEQY